jgi:Reverse transcriptase (RNA-dependent DNA polymerase).
VYLDEIITKCQKEDIKEIPLSKNQQLLRLLFADDQVIISNTEDNLQKAAYKLNKIITGHGLTTSVKKTKLKAFKGQAPVRNKIAIDNKIIEQINSFNYLGNLIYFEKDVEDNNKLNNYFK